MESIAELREICQATRQTAIYRMNWFDRNVLRRMSIYLSRKFIKTGTIGPDGITLLDFIFVLLAGVSFLSPQPAVWLIGMFVFFLYLLIDCVDGEVARYMEYKGTRKPQPLGRGSFLGGVVDAFVWPYVFACMSFGLYLSTGSLLAFVAGFTAAIMRMLYMDLGLIVYPILHDYDKLADIRSSTETIGEPKLMALGRFAFGIQGFLPSMLLVIILDWILGTPLRLVYLGLYGLGATIGVLARVRNVYKYGVRIQRI